LFQNLPPGRVFALDLQTFISVAIHLINLAVLAYVMARLLYNPVRDFMFKRTARISEQLMLAKEGMSDAEELKHEYEEKIKGIELEREELLAAASKHAAEQREQLLIDAGKEAQAMKAAAAAEIELEKKRLQDEMMQVILSVSSAMAEKYISLALDEAAHAQLFTQTIAELEDATWWN